MKGLSAKVFRTYNASITFQNQLDEGTPEDGTLQEKLNHYNHANRMVAILCNHQRAAPKTHDQSMAKMKEKVWLTMLFWTDTLLTPLVPASRVKV
jgi:DNA topoisomerase I